MKNKNKQFEEVAARINAGRKSGLANVTGTTIEEMKESFYRSFNISDDDEQCQMKGFHGHTKKKHICG